MKEFTNDYTVRFRPDFRYCDDKFDKIGLKNFESTEPSVTDKEAYRMTLATLRGALAQGSGPRDVGSYSLQPNEEYDAQKDFSFLQRKDVTLVEIDEYIKNFEKHCESYDESLRNQIELELAQKKANLESSTTDKKVEKE